MNIPRERYLLNSLKDEYEEDLRLSQERLDILGKQGDFDSYKIELRKYNRYNDKLDAINFLLEPEIPHNKRNLL